MVINRESKMIDQNINIQIWTSVPGKFGDEQKCVGEISVKEIAEFSNVDVADVETLDLIDYVKDMLVHHENNREE